jgi:uncharacterized protein YneF (UPF0154 family)
MPREFLWLIALLAGAALGRFTALPLPRHGSNVFRGWLAGAGATIAVFLLGLCVFPPFVLDPTMVLMQLPFIGGLAGAAVETAAQLEALRRKKIPTAQAGKNCGLLVIIGVLCGTALLAYQWNLERQWKSNPPITVPLR